MPTDKAYDISSLKRGAVLRVKAEYFLGLISYSHYYIYAGNGEVIHVSKDKGIVARESLWDSLWELQAVGQVEEVTFGKKYQKQFSKKDCYQRANRRVGKKWEYDLLRCNCEQFAAWCRTGEAVSAQAFGIEAPAIGFAASIVSTELIEKFFNKLCVRVKRTYNQQAFEGHRSSQGLTSVNYLCR